jgi:hypothetical protein
MGGYSKTKRGRREFFKSVLRYTTLGVLGAIVGNVLAKKRRLARNGICINREICRSCEIFEECGLPPALLAKKNIKEIDNE